MGTWEEFFFFLSDGLLYNVNSEKSLIKQLWNDWRGAFKLWLRHFNTKHIIFIDPVLTFFFSLWQYKSSRGRGHNNSFPNNNQTSPCDHSKEKEMKVFLNWDIKGSLGTKKDASLNKKHHCWGAFMALCQHTVPFKTFICLWVHLF